MYPHPINRDAVENLRDRKGRWRYTYNEYNLYSLCDFRKLLLFNGRIPGYLSIIKLALYEAGTSVATPLSKLTKQPLLCIANESK